MKCLPRSYRSLLILVALGCFDSYKFDYSLIWPDGPAKSNRSDRSIFRHCRLLGHQDTLFADFGRQYYVDSYIEGGVDYIFGNAAAVFERDELHSNGPGYITAQSRTSADQPTGYVILNSRITTTLDPATNQTTYLGRPWRPYARVIFINTELPANINPAGWGNWPNPANESTAYYAESNSTGPGASPTTRVHWSHQLTPSDAAQFLPNVFLAGSDHWNPIAAATVLGQTKAPPTASSPQNASHSQSKP